MPLLANPMITPDADVLIVGGGVAGWSAAYFAARAGREVTLVDAGLHRASDLPIALVNPLRGRAGRLVPRGIEGTRATFALVDALQAAGHRIEHGRGLFRPLVGVAAKARERDYWKALLPDHFAFEWHDAAPALLGLADATPALYLSEAGWLAPHGLLAALKSESDAIVIDDEVLAIDVDAETHGGVVSLASGSRLTARSLLWCGGAWGAARLDATFEENFNRVRLNRTQSNDAIYKPGCLVTTSTPLTQSALSFGLYAIPLSGTCTLVGPTREPSQREFPNDAIPDEAITQLQDRVARVFGASMTASSIWRGVRLVRPSSAVLHALRDVPSITALGSRGFLMAPLLASEWALSL